MANGGLDVLPHNGAVITRLSIGRLSHREAHPEPSWWRLRGPMALILVVALDTS